MSSRNSVALEKEQILRCAQNDTRAAVILNEVKDLLLIESLLTLKGSGSNRVLTRKDRQRERFLD
jgi:hypothetical protein